ncbi:MAG: Gfo/Idh/MocA family oxidoreductase [Verrucomicrobia bacterium]|nr:Gfo/Idh/MocA family oxidoreductase [Verrucomicrobiota bacterium]
MAPVRFGIIGAGVIANLMARVFTEGRDACAVAVADVNAAAAQKLAAAAGAARIHADYRELLRDPEVEAVYIATPPFLHRPMTLDALRAGKHVCCEKPFFLTQAEAREVLAAQRANPRLKVNCCSSRYHNSGTARRARQAVAAGELGTLYRVHFEQVTGAPKPGTVLPPWRNDPAKNGGGISFDWGPYDLDWLAFVLGDRFRPERLFGTVGSYFPLTAERVPPCLNVDGRLSAEILCAGGLTIHWERRAAEHGPARHNVELRGTRAGLDLAFLPMGEKPVLHHYAYVGAADLAETKLPDAPPAWDDTLVHPIRELSAAIREDRAPASPLEVHVRIHGVFDALLASARTGQAVAIDSTV